VRSRTNKCGLEVENPPFLEQEKEGRRKGEFGMGLCPNTRGPTQFFGNENAPKVPWDPTRIWVKGGLRVPWARPLPRVPYNPP